MRPQEQFSAVTQPPAAHLQGDNAQMLLPQRAPRKTVSSLALTWRTLRLLPLLARTRFAARERSGWLDFLSIIATAICTWMALTLAGGTWMFVQLRDRFDANSHLGRLAIAYGKELAAVHGMQTPFSAGDTYRDTLNLYVILAGIASFIALASLIALGAAATRLGAVARARRLAALRLIGVDAASVRLLVIVEAVFWAILGIGLGIVLWLVTLPAWRFVTMVGQPLQPKLMLMPADKLLLVVLAILAVAIVAAINGIQAVAITPLGVAKQSLTASIRLRRLIVAVVMIGILSAIFPRVIAVSGYSTVALVIVSGVIFVVTIGLVNLTLPYLLRVVAIIGLRKASPARMIALSRVRVDPRPAARSAAGIAIVYFAATVTNLPAEVFDARSTAPSVKDQLNLLILHDINTGFIITISIIMILAVTAILIQQCSAVYDMKETVAALTKLGAPFSLWQRARVAEAAMPILTAAAAGSVAGLVLISPLHAAFGMAQNWVRLLIIFVLLALAIALVYALSLLVNRLQLRVLAARTRAND